MLTNEQKLKIQSSIVDAEDSSTFIKQMSTELGVPQKDVMSYMTEMTQNLLKIEANSQQKEKQIASNAEKAAEKLPDSCIQQVISSLTKAGLRLDHAQSLLNRALSNLDLSELDLNNEQQVVNTVYTLSLGQINSSDTLIKETRSGRKGVSIMTEASSQRSDTEMSKTKILTHKSRNSVYSVNGDKKE